MYNSENSAIYAPNPLALHAAHSIYFQVLGERGFVGLFLLMGKWLSVWRKCNWLIRNDGDEPETLWCKVLGAMCKVSLISYAVGAAFLSFFYYNLSNKVLVFAVLTCRWIAEKAWLTARLGIEPTPNHAGAENP